MAYTEEEQIFEALDELVRLSVPTDRFAYLLTKRKDFNLTIDRAEAYILSWLDAKYLQRTYEIEQWYKEQLQDLREAYLNKLQDVADEKAAKIARADLSQVLLKQKVTH